LQTIPFSDRSQSVLAGETAYVCPSCDLRGIDLAGKNLTNANLAGANLAGADLRGAILNGAILTGANLKEARLDGAQLTGAALSSADLTGASLQEAQLDRTDLQFADLTGADFTSTDLTTASLGAEIKAGLLDGNQKTSFQNANLPRGFTVDPTIMHLEGVTWLPPAELEAAPANEPVVCGKADLSNLTSRIYVAPTGTDSNSCGGSDKDACQTIAQGIKRCTGAGCGVLVAWGSYSPQATVQLQDGVDVYGGCLPQSKAKPEYFSTIQAPPGGQPAVSADGINSGVILQGFQLNASPAGGTSGTASVALLVTNSAKLEVLNTEILASTGGPGATGGSGHSGTSGGAANGRSGGTISACEDTTGGDGAVQMGVSVDVGFSSFTCNPSCSANGCYGYLGAPGDTGISVAGGKWGDGNCVECPATGSRGGTGHSGTEGGNAGCGTKGAANADVAGSFSGPIWTASVGGAGSPGGDGGGGGGGGAGGYTAGACFWASGTFPGNSGGGGGAGGCGGAQGSGGQQGGAAFAMVAVNSTITIKESRIVGGTGGNGGQGGTGGSGSTGGAKADGATDQGGGYGGSGGAGGAGGAGGGGAGGNGGPAVGIALIGNAAVTDTNTVYYTGVSGFPGDFGKGGNAINADVCTGPDGDSGLSGLVADKHQYGMP
jgi:uncharacterized protein YjbI with pentapeptide repeats